MPFSHKEYSNFISLECFIDAPSDKLVSFLACLSIGFVHLFYYLLILQAYGQASTPVHELCQQLGIFSRFQLRPIVLA